MFVRDRSNVSRVNWKIRSLVAAASVLLIIGKDAVPEHGILVKMDGDVGEALWIVFVLVPLGTRFSLFRSQGLMLSCIDCGLRFFPIDVGCWL